MTYSRCDQGSGVDRGLKSNSIQRSRTSLLAACLLLLLVLLAVIFVPAGAGATVSIEFVSVSAGEVGNPCDPQGIYCFGRVFNEFRIGKFEVTNAQYAEYLNKVAVTDDNGLYHPGMGNFGGSTGTGSITQTGAPGSYVYTVVAGRENWPINYTNFYHSLRFINWLENGQPTGAQDDTTTEDGSYTLDAIGIADNSILRNPGATHFLPTENEWYKAAYYDSSTQSYFDFPTQSNIQTICSLPNALTNQAKCGSSGAPFVLVDVGSFTGSEGPYSTFDQGGSVWEWSESIFAGHCRGQRGGSYTFFDGGLAASWRDYSGVDAAQPDFGFRVAALPASASRPSVPTLSPTILFLVAILVLVVSARSLARAPA